MLNLIKILFYSIWKNKFRFFFVLCGLAVGLSIFISIFSIGTSINKIISRFSKLDHSRRIYISGFIPFDVIDNLLNEYNSIIESIDLSSKYVFHREIVYKGKSLTRVYVYYLGYGTGSLGCCDKLKEFKIFSYEEVREGKSLCFISEELYKNIFRHRNPIGEKIIIFHKDEDNPILKSKKISICKIKGILPKNDDELAIYLPYKFWVNEFSLFSNIYNYQPYYIVITLKNVKKLEFIYFNILKMLRQKNISFELNSSYIKSLEHIEVINNFKLYIYIFAIISFISGCIGLMSLMNFIINNRLEEIAIRKVFGASNKDIFIQFLIEFLFVSIIGIIVGILLGIIQIQVILNYLPFFISINFPYFNIICIIMFCVFIILLSVAIPLINIRKLYPIEILRK